MPKIRPYWMFAALTLAPCFAFAAQNETESFAVPTDSTIRKEIAGTDETFVTLSRAPMQMSNLPTNVTVIREFEIRETGAKTVADVLGFSPSVLVQRSGPEGTFATARLRGTPSSSQTQVLVDGQSLGGVSIQFVDLSQITVDNVERIEIVRGSSANMNGANTIGGTINIITKKSAKGTTVLAQVEGGSLNTKYIRAGADIEKGPWQTNLTLSGLKTDGYQGNGDVDDKHAALSVKHGFDNGATAGLQMSRFTSALGNPHGTTVPLNEWNGHLERTPADPNANTQNSLDLLRLTGAMPISTIGAAEALLSYSNQNYKTYPAQNGDADFVQKNGILGADVKAFFQSGTTLGTQLEQDKQESTQATSPQTSYRSRNIGVYGQQELTWQKMLFIPALRVDKNSTFGSFTSPRITLVYKENEDVTFSGNLARAFRAPNFMELYYEPPAGYLDHGNPNLDPEKGTTADIGAALNFAKTNQFKITAFVSHIKDRIAYTMAENTWENIPVADAKGLELELAGRVILPGAWILRHNVSFTSQRATGNSVSSSEQKSLALTPDNMGTAQLAFLKNNWNFSNTFRYRSALYQYAGHEGTALPSVFTWNARLGVTLKPWTLYANVSNILNALYGDTFDFAPAPSYATTINPQADRTFTAGVEYTFKTP